MWLNANASEKTFWEQWKYSKSVLGGWLPDFINVLNITELPCIMGELYGMQFTPQ